MKQSQQKEASEQEEMPSSRLPEERGEGVSHSKARLSNLVVGMVALVALFMLVWKSPKSSSKPPTPPWAQTPEQGEHFQQASSSFARLSKALEELEKMPNAERSAPLLKILDVLSEVGFSNVGRKMPDGTDPPPLPAKAPKYVRIGVILFLYRGAQLAPDTSPRKDQAAAQAESVLVVAKEKFHEAVKLGSPGSDLDIGIIPRGVLEPAVEYAVFSLDVGQVSAIIDTPRGFWIVKRLL